MYDERREHFSIRDVILQILLVVLFVFIMIWLFPTKNYLKDNNQVDNNELYVNYITSMTEAAKDYFTVSRMPNKVGDSVKLTLKDMLEQKLILEIGGNASCDLEKSYIEVTKMDVDYQLRVELSCAEYSNYVLVTMGCRDYCTECEIITPGNNDDKDKNPTQQSTKKYTVTFDSNGGSAVSKQTVESGKKATKPANPTRDGYTFVNWTLNGKEYNFNTKVTKNITLVAQWKKVGTSENPEPPVVKYTVTFDSNGGSIVSSQTVVSGAKATKPTNPTRDGYTFVNWTLNGTEYDFNTAVTSNIILVAQWKKVETPVVKYTVTFDSNGGSSVSSQTVVSGAKATKPSTPARNGYIFVNWTLNGKTYDFNTPVTSNITLVAQWKKVETPVVKYTVTFNSNGGSAVSSQTVVSGAKATKPTNPTRKYYTFVNWTLNGKKYDFNTPVTSNITLVAKWDEVVYYQYRKTITGSHTYYTDWSSWSSTQTYWGLYNASDYEDTDTTQYRVIETGSEYIGNTGTACNNETTTETVAVDITTPTKQTSGKQVEADAIVKESTQFGPWTYSGEASSARPLSTSVASDATVKYVYKGTVESSDDDCSSCTSSTTYLYYTYTRTAETVKKYSCPSGYTASGSGSSTECYKTETTTSLKCPSGYTLENDSCIKYEKKEVTKENCFQTPVKDSYVKYQYRTRSLMTGNTYSYDYEYSTDDNDTTLRRKGYKLTGKVCTYVNNKRVCE